MQSKWWAYEGFITLLFQYFYIPSIHMRILLMLCGLFLLLIEFTNHTADKNNLGCNLDIMKFRAEKT